jgi:hypothetical protein
MEDGMIRRKGLLALAVANALASSVVMAEISDIDSLRAKCMEVANNAQMKKFDMKILCSGHYTYWEEAPGAFSLPNNANMYAQTTTKCNRFQTAEVSFHAQLPAHAGSCGRYTKRTMRAPDEVGIPVAITDCAQLTHEFVEATCQERLHQYCHDQFVDRAKGGAPGSSASEDAMCVLEVGEVVDTCAMY